MKLELNQNPLRKQGAGSTMLLAYCAVLALFAGCGGGEGGGGGVGQSGSAKSKNTVTNESVFNRRPGAGSKNLGLAYQDGFDAGRKSATDMNMNWMKNWDKDADWRTEYDRGWKDGRNLRKMQDQRSQNAGGK